MEVSRLELDSEWGGGGPLAVAKQADSSAYLSDRTADVADNLNGSQNAVLCDKEKGRCRHGIQSEQVSFELVSSHRFLLSSRQGLSLLTFTFQRCLDISEVRIGQEPHGDLRVGEWNDLEKQVNAVNGGGLNADGAGTAGGLGEGRGKVKRSRQKEEATSSIRHPSIHPSVLVSVLSPYQAFRLRIVSVLLADIWLLGSARQGSEREECGVVHAGR